MVHFRLQNTEQRTTEYGFESKEIALGIKGNGPVKGVRKNETYQKNTPQDSLYLGREI